MRWLLVAMVVLGCSSSSSSKAQRVEADGGTSTDADNPSVPPGGSCEESTECELLSDWPHPNARPEPMCKAEVCTFAVAGNSNAIEACQELGGTFESPTPYCLFP